MLLQAEFTKQRHSVFYPLHIGIPVLYVLVMALLFWGQRDTPPCSIR